MFSTERQDVVSKSLPTTPISALVGHEGPIQDVCFTADGKYCLTAGYDRTVRLWNPLRKDPACHHIPDIPPISSSSINKKGVPLNSIPHALPIQAYSNGYAYPVSSISIDDKSTTIASSSDKTLLITDVITSKVKQKFHGHVGRINKVAISDECETYLSASYDGTCRIWDGRSNSREPIQTLNDATDSVTDINIIQDDNNKASIQTSSVDGFVRTYDIRMGQIKCDNCSSSITSITPTHDGQCLAISCLDGTIRLMEQDSGELLNTYGGGEVNDGENGSSSSSSSSHHHKAGNYSLQCTITSDDAYVVTGSEDGNAMYYNLVDAKVVQTLMGHKKPTCSIASYPPQIETNDNNYKSSVLITASYDGNGIVWANKNYQVSLTTS